MSITLDDIYRAKRKLEETTLGREQIYGVRVSPDVLAAFRRELPEWAGEAKEERWSRGALWGIPCIMDTLMPAGTVHMAFDRETWLRWCEEQQ